MKCIIFTSLIYFILIKLTIQQWPKVENVKKSHYLPSLEVKIHPPDQFQPKVQAEIRQLEDKREKNEKTWMQELETAYNRELVTAGKELMSLIKAAVSVFDDTNLLKKSVEYAINPPLIVMTNNMQTANSASQLKPSFREIANFKMNDLQQQTMKILVEDDNKIEKLRGAKISITMDEPEKDNNNININNKIKLENNVNLVNRNSQYTFKQKPVSSIIKPYRKFHNGPIETSNFNLQSSFVEMGMGVKMGAVKYTKPISVLMKLPSEPDPKIKKEIGNLESKREGFEGKLFKQAKVEFKLVTALTKKELQLSLNHELLPFFMVSKNSLSKLNDVISNIVPSQTKNKSAFSRFLEINKDELKEKFPQTTDNQVTLNQSVYNGILDFFLGDSSSSSSSSSFNNEQAKLRAVNNKSNLRSRKRTEIILDPELTQDQEPQDQESQDQEPQDPKKDLIKTQVDFNYEKCLELAKNLKHIDCNTSQSDYNELNDYLHSNSLSHSSFLQMTQDDGSDLINVKFAASDEPYPTIEKLVSQMMTRRDLAEKFERLKILEYESHLQKAENEMIQDILHENIFRIMAFYGPSIEGMKEHIH